MEEWRSRGVEGWRRSWLAVVVLRSSGCDGPGGAGRLVLEQGRLGVRREEVGVGGGNADTGDGMGEDALGGGGGGKLLVGM